MEQNEATLVKLSGSGSSSKIPVRTCVAWTSTIRTGRR
jgi:hypothetical protein